MPKERTVRVTLRIPMIMRQAIKGREKLSGQPAAGVIQGILLTSLRVEMEILSRQEPEKPVPNRRQVDTDQAQSSLRKVK